MPFDLSVVALVMSVAHEKTAAVKAHRTLRPGLPRGYQLSSLAASAKEVEGSQKVNSKKCISLYHRWDQKVNKSLYHSLV